MISLDDARQALRQNPAAFATTESLRALVAQLSIEANGAVTVLYSGYTTGNGQATGDIHSHDLVDAMVNRGENIRIVDQTDAAKLLNSTEFKAAVARIYEIDIVDFLDKNVSSDGKTAANNWLFNGRNGPWADISGRFIEATVGEVRTITGGALGDRVFAQTEVPAMLRSQNITYVDGISIEKLQAFGESGALQAIRAQSAIDSAFIKIATDSSGIPILVDGQLRTDTREFFARTPGIEGKAPLIETPMRNIGEFMTPASVTETHADGAQHLREIKAELTAQSNLPGTENAGARAAAKSALTRLGIAGDILSLAFVVKDANAAHIAGDDVLARQIVSDWALDFGGGLAGGLLAAQLVGAAVLPLYALMPPFGAIVAGGLTLLAGIVGGVMGGQASVKAGAFLSDATQSLLTHIRSLFGQASTARSPLILDLNGDGVKTLSLSSSTITPINFDHDGNHFAEQTGWVSAEDGLLVLDRNADGSITSGAELFGNYTVIGNGTQAANGFSALADLDANSDGKVNASDAAFASLKVWKDANSDGVAQTGELLTLAAAGVASLNTGYTNATTVDANGNAHKQIGSFTRTNGSTGSMNDVWFAVDTARTIDLQRVTESDTIQALPEVQGFGNVHSLRQAMARDSTGALQNIVTQFGTATTTAARQALMKVSQRGDGAKSCVRRRSSKISRASH